MPACAYSVDDTDRLDVALAQTLRKLDTASAGALWLRRLGPSKYDIDGRRVTINLRTDGTTLGVTEDDIPHAERRPLLEYLEQAAAVAISVAASRRRKGVTTDDGRRTASVLAADEDNERLNSMLVACSRAGVVKPPEGAHVKQTHLSCELTTV